MKHFPLNALSCCLAALGAAACGHAPQSESGGSPAAPPGIRYEAHMAAGGIAPRASKFKIPQGNGTATATTGGTLFATLNCDGCHGGGATGWVGPSLIDGRWRYGGADEEIFSSIYYGRPKGMPAYGGVIGTDGVWMLVAYLRSQPPPSIVPTTSYEDMDKAPPAAAPAAALPSSTVASSAAATPIQMLAQYGCAACHAVDQKVIGPALIEVAAKYRGSDVENALTEKVRNGGSGVWGTIPMTPNPQVPDEDLHRLVKWVLALK